MTKQELKNLLTTLNSEYSTPIQVNEVLTLVKDQIPVKETIVNTTATWVPISFTDGTRVALPSLIGRNTGLTIDDLTELINKGGQIKCVAKTFISTSMEGRRKALYKWQII